METIAIFAQEAKLLLCSFQETSEAIVLAPRRGDESIRAKYYEVEKKKSEWISRLAHWRLDNQNAMSADDLAALRSLQSEVSKGFLLLQEEFRSYIGGGRKGQHVQHKDPALQIWLQQAGLARE